MKKILLSDEEEKDCTIMIFSEGTILKPKSWLQLYNHKTYVPIGNSVEKIRTWQMCITKVKPELKAKITSVVVPEFHGIDYLPDMIEILKEKH